MKEQKSKCCGAKKKIDYSTPMQFASCAQCQIPFISESSEEKEVIDRMQNQIIDNMEKSNYPMKVYIPPTDSDWEVKLAEEGTPMAKFQKERTDAISEMFDNKYANGIYPTSKFFYRLDKCVDNLIQSDRSEQKAKMVEEIKEKQKSIRLEQFTVDTILEIINK